MPGLSKTANYQFTTASVLVAPMTAQLTINSLAHSIGMVKNLNVSSDTGFVELTQGVQNQLVASMVNKFSVKCSCEVYEYTSRNLAYGLGLDGTVSGATYAPYATDYPLAAAVAAAATTATVTTNVASTFPLGQWGYLQQGVDDICHIFKTNAAAVFSASTSISFTGYPVPAGMAFDTTAGVIGAINKIDSNPAVANQYFAVRIVGVTSDPTQRPVIIHFPKAKVTKGFAMAFESNNFANLPFEFTPVVPAPSDPGYSSDFSQMMSVLTPN